MRDEWERRDGRDGQDPKFEVLGSKFQKPRTSNMKPRVSLGYSHVSRVARREDFNVRLMR